MEHWFEETGHPVDTFHPGIPTIKATPRCSLKFDKRDPRSYKPRHVPYNISILEFAQQAYTLVNVDRPLSDLPDFDEYSDGLGLLCRQLTFCSTTQTSCIPIALYCRNWVGIQGAMLATTANGDRSIIPIISKFYGRKNRSNQYASSHRNPILRINNPGTLRLLGHEPVIIVQDAMYLSIRPDSTEDVETADCTEARRFKQTALLVLHFQDVSQDLYTFRHHWHRTTFYGSDGLERSAITENTIRCSSMAYLEAIVLRHGHLVHYDDPDVKPLQAIDVHDIQFSSTTLADIDHRRHADHADIDQHRHAAFRQNHAALGPDRTSAERNGIRCMRYAYSLSEDSMT